MANMSAMDFYMSQSDYEHFAPYLSLDDDGFQLPFQAPEFAPNYDSAIIVDGTPITTTDKVPKLLQALLKVFIQFSPSLRVEDFELPIDPATGSTLGFCFINFANKYEAEAAILNAQGFLFGKNVFKLSPYSDLDKYKSLQQEFVPPQLPEFKPRPDPTDWLCDLLGRDQFAIRYAKETEVYWANMSNEDPVLVYGGERVSYFSYQMPYIPS